MSDPTRSSDAEAFDDADVARCYRHRPPYAPAAIAHVISLATQRKRALDLGCGPGKVALELAPHFESVDAVDPSQPMLDVARKSGTRNVRWICSTTEQAPLEDHYDLVTAGTSIHWMDHAVVFPRLRKLLDARGFVAVLHGDRPHEPPWAAEWDPFLRRWLSRMGRTYDPVLWSRSPHERWIDIAGRETFTADVTRSVAEMVECEHSRATWARARMGAALAAELDRELTALLEPYTRDGLLHFRVQTHVVWGVPRSEPARE
jgi:ubiquinone/menaquinone biosynthesis C-methylase UbiE